MEENYTYMLECADHSLYTGWTNDLVRRLHAHQSGKGGKYTRARLPVRLVYYESFSTKQEAMRREWQIKRLSRVQKQQLIKSGLDEAHSTRIAQYNAGGNAALGDAIHYDEVADTAGHHE